MSASSHSDSDSDREPNSHGARVFWGNVKTPERSRSVFVNPPKTVVKQHHHPRSIPLSIQEHSAADEMAEEKAIEKDNDEATGPARLDETLISVAVARAVDLDSDLRDVQQSDQDPVDHLLEVTNSELPQVPTTQPFLATLKARFSDADSEREVQCADVQPSPAIHMLLDGSPCMEAYDLQDSQTVSRSESLSPVTPPLKSAANDQPASQLPDLISFDMPMPTRIPPTDSITDSITGSPLHSDAASNRSASTSSYAIIDELLTLSPQQTSRLSPNPSSLPEHIRTSECQPVVSTLSPSPPEPTLIGDYFTTHPSSSGQSLMLPGQLSPTADHPVGTTETLSRQHDAQNGSIQDTVDTITTVVAKPDDTPGAQTDDEVKAQTLRHTGSVLPHTPGAETRKRTTVKNWKSKAKVDDASSPSESSTGTSNEVNEQSSHGGEMDDSAIKKERRARVKEEAERRRPLLMSLSPTSAEVLNLLTSPVRGSPPRLSPPRTLGNLVFECISANTQLQPKPPATPTAGPSTPARRVPITTSSPRRLDGPPVRLDRPNPVHLDDPRRTPARRVPLSASQTQPRPLPLDDPNRTPARRVPIVLSSPAKQVEKAVAQGTHAHQTDESPVASSSAIPAKPETESLPPKGDGPPQGNHIASIPAASRLMKPLLFPIAQQQSGIGKPGADSSDSSSLPMAVNSPFRPPSSGLRQQSSVSVNKIRRIGAKPYSRPGHMQSRLPKPSSSRLPIPGTGFGPAGNSAGPSRITTPCTAAPTRIPSPVKRRVPYVDIPGPSPTPPVLPDTNTGGPPVSSTYRRKRTRTMTEDSGSDEPPAKRPTIVIRQVTKGMFNKTASMELGSSTSHRVASPARPTRSPGPLQIRPDIQGTLGRFETTRSYSGAVFKFADENTSPDTGPSSLVPDPLALVRDESPAVDTDTASTVTTLSREPTLDDMPISSSSALGPEPFFTFATLAEPGPEPRRITRARKAASALATRRDPLPLTRTTSMIQRGTSSSKSSKLSTRALKSPSISMNQRQLQAITQANTVHNQLYIADLQRQVVRKEGPRPASPTTKVRTIMEKAREANAKGREARAERRRRRGQGSVSANSEDDSIDFKDVSSSPLRDHVSGFLGKHARGPGDEEDYETPERAPKPSRLDPDKLSKNVKWDRGLARSMSEFAAEQAAKQAQDTATAESIRKGCLARDPKTLHLDPLGNVPDANIPLDNLGRERVIVTRFIYDDDDDMEATRVAKKKKL